MKAYHIYTLAAAILCSTSGSLAQISKGSTLTNSEPVPAFNYSFENGMPADDSQSLTGSVENGALIQEIGHNKVLFTGSNNGFMDFGEQAGKAFFSGVTDFTLSLDLYSETVNNLNNLGNFICCFSSLYPVVYGQNQDEVQYIFLGAKNLSYTINNKLYGAQQSVGYDKNIACNTWQNITYVQSGDTGTLYLNGEVIGQKDGITIKPADMADNFIYNWLGRSCWSADSYLKNAYIDNFKIYHEALTEEQVGSLCQSLDDMNQDMSAYIILNAIDLGNLDNVKTNLTLPTEINGVAISWSSSHPETISADGTVNRPQPEEDNREVVLTATVNYNGTIMSREFTATVIHLFTDQASVEYDTEQLTIPSGYLNNAKWYLPLPSAGERESHITWTSSDPSYINEKGELLKFSTAGEPQAKVTMTATISKGDEKREKAFEATIAYPEEQYDGYLFAYFEGSGDGAMQEHLRFGVSSDAVNWSALNKNQPIIMSDTISQSGGIRDPHILRGEDGHTFYIVATDMYVHRYGWGSNPGIVLMKSDDLINWSHAYINLSQAYPEHFGDAHWVWAPQTIYDPSAGKYMIYFTLKRSTSNDLITYYAYANEDFTAFEEEPEVLFSAKYGSIDNDIIYKDGLWHLFYKGNTKDEQGVEYINGIQQAVCPTLHGDWKEDFIYLDVYAGKTPVEGSGIFKLNDDRGYVLMYDLYTSLRYEYQISKDLFDFGTSSYSFTKNFNPRHGTVTGITREEATRLNDKWGGVPDDLITNVNQPKTQASSLSIRQENGGKVYIESPQAQTLKLYTIDGKLQTTTELQPNQSVCLILKPGIYIANNTKIAVM